MCVRAIGFIQLTIPELRSGWRLANESCYSEISESVAKGFVLKDN